MPATNQNIKNIESLISDKKYLQAKDLVLESLAISPSNTELLRLLGKIMIACKNWRMVFKTYSQIIEVSIQPKLLDHVNQILGAYQLLLTHKFQIEKALKILEQSQKKFPDSIQLLLYKARILSLKEDLAASAKIWHRIYYQNPEQLNITHIIEYSNILRKLSLYDQAEDLISKQIESHTESQILIKEKNQIHLEKSINIYTLSKNTEYTITYFQQKKLSDVLFITFGAAPSDMNSPPFGFEFLIKQGFDLIYIAQRKGTQYQGLSTDDFFNAVNPISKNKKTFTYGSSLGGYCALYFSGVINAVAIAAGPRNPCDPSLKEFSTALGPYRNQPYLHKEMTKNPKSSQTPFIIYDPMIDIDSHFMERKIIPAYPNANIWKIAHGGHPTLKLLAEQKILKSTILEIVNKNKFPDTSFNLNEHSAIWNLEKGLFLQKQKNHLEASTYFKKSILITPSADAYFALVESLKEIKENNIQIEKTIFEAKKKFPRNKKILLM
ncbi:MAG: tetratricopeptide repeat protein [Pseudomonadota bacterium]|nr:tetratricopeptide repeat protein [Pseudomonadota bacterium]